MNDSPDALAVAMVALRFEAADDARRAWLTEQLRREDARKSKRERIRIESLRRRFKRTQARRMSAVSSHSSGTAGRLTNTDFERETSALR